MVEVQALVQGVGLSARCGLGGIGLSLWEYEGIPKCSGSKV